MSSKLIIVAFVVLLCGGPGFGQSASDIESRFGRSENVYSVGEHLWMTPVYATDGQVCSMRLYPKRFSSGSNNLDEALAMDEVLKFINELIPLKTRGSRKKFFGITEMGGGTAWTHFDYERVSFTFVTSFKLEKMPERQGGDVLDLKLDEKSLAEAEREEERRSDDELMRLYTALPKVLEIRWADRKCPD